MSTHQDFPRPKYPFEDRRIQVYENTDDQLQTVLRQSLVSCHTTLH